MTGVAGSQTLRLASSLGAVEMLAVSRCGVAGPSLVLFSGRREGCGGCGFHNNPSGVTNQPGNSAILAACV